MPEVLQLYSCLQLIKSDHQMVNKLIDGVSFLKSKFQTDELDEKLAQAVSEENWQASTQLLHQIANAAYNFEKEQRILTFIWEKLKSKSWRKVLKTLHLVDFLAKNGPTSSVNAFKENIYEFRNFDGFTLVAEGLDRGQSIRKQSKVIVDLLSDDHCLNDERAKAKQIKERMANVIGSGAYYGSYSNDGPTSSSTKKEGYESYSVNSYKLGMPSSNGGGMSFGESVMRTLNESKKVERKVEQPVVEEKPASKLNLSKMNEKKAEEGKKSFNALSMKLVKPPEKKPETKKTETALSPPPAKVTKKPVSNVDIMDLDLINFGSSPQPVVAQNKTSTINSDPFDFLGGTSSNQYQPPAQTPAPNFSNSLFATNPTPPPQNITSPTLYPQQNSNFSFSLSQPVQSQPQPFISLAPTPQPKPQPSSNLIDFSNFREQLTQIGHQQQKKSIVQQWNW